MERKRRKEGKKNIVLLNNCKATLIDFFVKSFKSENYNIIWIYLLTFTLIEKSLQN